MGTPKAGALRTDTAAPSVFVGHTKTSAASRTLPTLPGEPYHTCAISRSTASRPPSAYRGARRKIRAYHLYVQIGCIAQGLLIHLAIHHGQHVWGQFRSRLRTMDPTRPSSALVVAYSLRDSLSDFLEDDGQDAPLRKIRATCATADTSANLRMAG